MTQIPENIPIKIIDLHAEDIAKKLVNTFGLNENKIINEDSDIKSWIRNNFKYLSYRAYIKNRRHILDILGINKKDILK